MNSAYYPRPQRTPFDLMAGEKPPGAPATFSIGRLIGMTVAFFGVVFMLLVLTSDRPFAQGDVAVEQQLQMQALMERSAQMEREQAAARVEQHRERLEAMEKYQRSESLAVSESRQGVKNPSAQPESPDKPERQPAGE